MIYVCECGRSPFDDDPGAALWGWNPPAISDCADCTRTYRIIMDKIGGGEDESWPIYELERIDES